MTAGVARARAIIQRHTGRRVRVQLDGDVFVDGYLGAALICQALPAGHRWLVAVFELAGDAVPAGRSWWAVSVGPSRALGPVRYLPIAELERIGAAP